MKNLNSIVFIDDDEITNFINIELILESELTNNAISFTHAGQALEFLCMTPTELVFLDINMPNMDGFEFLEAYNKANNQCVSRPRNVVLSSSTYQKDLDRLQNLGVAEMIEKPLNKEKLHQLFA